MFIYFLPILWKEKDASEEKGENEELMRQNKADI